MMSLGNRDLSVEEPGARWFLTNFALEALQIHPEPTQAAVTRGGERAVRSVGQLDFGFSQDS